jgi:hypothetical protein
LPTELDSTQLMPAVERKRQSEPSAGSRDAEEPRAAAQAGTGASGQAVPTEVNQEPGPQRGEYDSSSDRGGLPDCLRCQQRWILLLHMLLLMYLLTIKGIVGRLPGKRCSKRPSTHLQIPPLVRRRAGCLLLTALGRSSRSTTAA